MQSAYDDWASIYDSIYSYFSDDIPFYVDAALQSNGPVLELGCGTGRVAIPIAKAGIDIVGLDSSESMLEIARQKKRDLSSTTENLSFIHGDMRDFSLETRFSLAIIPFRGFLSLLTVDDQRRTLENIRRHLEPGGKLAFNIFIPDVNMLSQEGDVLYHFRDVTNKNTGTRFVLWHQSSYNHYDQIINTRLIVEELDGGTAVTNRFYRDFQLRYIHRWEMYYLLELCSFEVESLHGDFDYSEFDETSTEMVWVAAVRK